MPARFVTYKGLSLCEPLLLAAQEQGELGCTACARCFVAQTSAVSLAGYARSGGGATGAPVTTTVVLQARVRRGLS